MIFKLGTTHFEILMCIPCGKGFSNSPMYIYIYVIMTLSFDIVLKVSNTAAQKFEDLGTGDFI